nr:MASE1 domain-containing protein [Gammaproteobacteria bacterium]
MRSLFQPLNVERQPPIAQTVLLIAALALSYFLAGKFVQIFLAMPGVYSISLWPSAGLALAAMLRFGNRLWPGVLLGALLINISVLLDTSSSQTFIKTFFIAGTIGIGATIQAV